MAAEPNFDLNAFASNLEFINPKATISALAAASREEALREIVDALVKSGSLRAEAVDEVVAALAKRESQGSTGIGNAVAVPHVKSASVERIVGSVAWSPAGIDFAAIDQEPVHLVILIIFPAEHGGAYLRALEEVSRLLRELPRPLFKKTA